MEAQKVHLQARTRTLFGKRARYARRAGFTPGNVYGPGAPSVAVEIATKELERVLTYVPRNALISLAVDAASDLTVLVQGVDRKPTTDELYHVDLYRVSMTRTLRIEVPLVLVGQSVAATMHDATILRALDSLHVECLPGDIPPEIEVDISLLVEIDDAIRVRDLKLPPGVRVLIDGDEMVVHAIAPTIAGELAAEVAAEAAAAEPVPKAVEASEPA
ncbi:MAG: 50S ribosomal protein L25 [Chloroflexi bacterium]|nr:50S ribosomal protein L25 [Chloroflexota bacterium]